MAHRFKVFDSHFHIIDKKFPLTANNGYLPDFFTITDYRQRTKAYDLAGGAVVSASFQAFDQTYLLAALQDLGTGFIGVTQIPDTTSDEQILQLDQAGVRGVRFNLKRGISDNAQQIEGFARRIFDLAGWHIELYIDSKQLETFSGVLTRLPAVSICHLGLSSDGFSHILKLAEKGVRIKATGFGRVDFDVKTALKKICEVNPDSLMFGTDLPSTRVRQPYSHKDFLLVVEALGEKAAQKVFYENAANFYFPHGKK